MPFQAITIHNRFIIPLPSNTGTSTTKTSNFGVARNVELSGVIGRRQYKKAMPSINSPFAHIPCFKPLPLCKSRQIFYSPCPLASLLLRCGEGRDQQSKLNRILMRAHPWGPPQGHHNVSVYQCSPMSTQTTRVEGVVMVVLGYRQNKQEALRNNSHTHGPRYVLTKLHPGVLSIEINLHQAQSCVSMAASHIVPGVLKLCRSNFTQEHTHCFKSWVLGICTIVSIR